MLWKCCAWGVLLIWLPSCFSQPVLGGTESGEPEVDADFDLALRHYWGDDVPIDYGRAYDLFYGAANRGHTLAKTFLAQQLYLGRGIQCDERLAVQWYKRAMPKLVELAAKGDPVAQIQCGYMYRNGLGVKKCTLHASAWYQLAADQDHPIGQCEMARVYDAGLGVEEDKKEALSWYRKAAAQGSARSQYNIGVMYFRGDGVEQDDAQALKWIRMAAQQKLPTAEIGEGTMCLFGRATKVDYEKAAKFYVAGAHREAMRMWLNQRKDAWKFFVGKQT